MNPAMVSTSMKAASTVWNKYRKARKQKGRDAYDLLEKAAAKVSDSSEDAAEDFSEARQKAGKVTQAAHKRLERALEEIKNDGGDLGEQLSSYLPQARDATAEAGSSAGKKAKKAAKKARGKARKTSKKVSKASEKATKKAAKKAKKNKSGGHRFLSIAGVIALLASIGGVLYYFLRGKERSESEVPPRVEEFRSNSSEAPSKLVYTSTSQAEGSALKESAAPKDIPAPSPKPEEQTGTQDDKKQDDTKQDEKKQDEKKSSSDSSLVEEGVVERDEELLDSIDEQLKNLRGDMPSGDAATDDTAPRVTDDHGHEGKHRL